MKKKSETAIQEKINMGKYYWTGGAMMYFLSACIFASVTIIGTIQTATDNLWMQGFGTGMFVAMSINFGFETPKVRE